MLLLNPIIYGKFRLVLLLCLQALLFMCSGCTTSYLWSNTPTWKYETVSTAHGKEFSIESPTIIKRGANPEIRLSYTDVQKMKNSNAYPPSRSGCIVLNHMDDSLRLASGLDAFLRSPSSLSISSIKAVISHEYPLYNRGSYKYKFRLGLTFKPADTSFERNSLQKTNSTWAPLLQGRPAQADIKQYSSQNAVFDKLYAPLDPLIIDPNDDSKSYFLVGGPSGGGPSGMTALTFVDDCSMPDYVTLLHKENTPFTIQFVEAKEIKQYKYPLPARVLLTPFSVAIDIVTSPVQLLFFIAWEHGGPR